MSTSTLDVIATRYSCRAFQDKALPAETLRLIAEAGVCAPSAVNRQPWRLVAISDSATIANIERVGLVSLQAGDPAGYDRIIARGGHLLYGATAMIIVATDAEPATWSPNMDAGIVASHIALAATSLGLGSCIAGLPRLAFQGETGQSLRETLIPEGFEFAISVLLGYPVADGKPHEPDFSKITYI